MIAIVARNEIIQWRGQHVCRYRHARTAITALRLGLTVTAVLAAPAPTQRPHHLRILE